jgi:hypothetical protein
MHDAYWSLVVHYLEGDASKRKQFSIFQRTSKEA